MTTYLRRPIVAHNPWLVAPFPGRASVIAGLTLHSTRSGRVMPNEGKLTERWYNNPSNRVPGTNYGSYCDLLLFKDGTQIVCTDWDREFATWTAGYGEGGNTWAMGHFYLQVELPQGTNDEPFTDAVVDSIARFTAEMAHRYSFPIRRLDYVAQTENPKPRGISTHDGCANGRAYGKSDTGKMFPWSRYLELAENYYNGEDGDMAAGDVERLQAQIDTLVKAGWTNRETLDAQVANHGSLHARLSALEDNDETPGPIGQVRRDLDAHLANHPGGQPLPTSVRVVSGELAFDTITDDDSP